jgi:hypothetical protein
MSSTDTETAREARRALRREWPGLVIRDGDHPEVDATTLTPEDRLRAAWTATCLAWALAGRRLPDVPRSDWPGDVQRPT